MTRVCPFYVALWTKTRAGRNTWKANDFLLVTVEPVFKTACVKRPPFQGPKSAILTVINLYYETTFFRSLGRPLNTGLTICLWFQNIVGLYVYFFYRFIYLFIYLFIYFKIFFTRFIGGKKNYKTPTCTE